MAGRKTRRPKKRPPPGWDTPLVQAVTTLAGDNLETLGDALRYALDETTEEQQAAPKFYWALVALRMAADGSGPMWTAQAAASYVVHGEPKISPRQKKQTPKGKRLPWPHR
jgi:hypothetical protein